MATRTAVTSRRPKQSNRTAADSEPLPRLGPPSTQAVRQPAFGDADRVVQWLNASTGTASHERVVLIRRELEDLPSDFASQAGAYVHSSGGVVRLGEPPSAKRGDWP